MNVTYDLNGACFVWNKNKAESNPAKHGLSFEVAAVAFFDPLLRFEDTSRNEDARGAVSPPEGKNIPGLRRILDLSEK